jgi:hypothetical protein
MIDGVGRAVVYVAVMFNAFQAAGWACETRIGAADKRIDKVTS